jgi:hypothetical protein
MIKVTRDVAGYSNRDEVCMDALFYPGLFNDAFSTVEVRCIK